MNIAQIRKEFHQRICRDIIRLQRDGETKFPNFADKSSKASKAIATIIIEQFGYSESYDRISGQSAGRLFETVTKDFIEESFTLLHHLRPGEWYYSTKAPISYFDQYQHLAKIEKIIKHDSELASSLGKDYIITPDIVIGRWPVSDELINKKRTIISPEEIVAKYTPFRQTNFEQPQPILHASISCKWTLRSDRGQNARTEALNLIRNRKGHLPHIMAITAEPLPTRIASLALGTGDLDCVYHFALPELIYAIKESNNEDQMDMLMILIEGRRLRDISDLPFDLAV